MTETETKVAPETPVKPNPKKKEKAAAKPKGKKVSATHPPTSVMVTTAILTLKEKGGSSLQAIKKYITATYKVDAEKLAPFIKKYLVGAVGKGELIQTKGKGASGSFKIASGKSESTSKPKAKPSKKVEKKTPKKVVAKKPAAKKEAKPKPKAKKVAAAKPKKAVIKTAKPKTVVKPKKKTVVKKTATKKTKK